MAYLGLEEQIQQVRTRDPRYRRDAYFFVLEALDFTIADLGRYAKDGLERHVCGRELAEGICRFATGRFGPLADRVFRYWGLETTLDIGQIVFNMVDCGLLNSRPEDKLEDFLDVFDFEQAFNTHAATQIDWDDLYWGADQN